MTSRFGFLDSAGPLAIAHRGGTSHAPENTLEAFQHAVDLGFTHLETDVHASADGVLYAFHDPSLDRVAGVPGDIADHPSDAIDRIRFADSRIPRFDELLTTWPTAMINVDPKSDAAVQPLVESIRRHRAIDRVCVGAFSDRRIAWCRRELGDDLCTSMGPFEFARLLLRSRGLPSAPLQAACAQIPPHWGLRLPLLPDLSVDLAEDRLLECAHDLGLPVHIWTIDDASEMHSLLELGVDGIMTDRPDVLRSVYLARSIWSSR